jgi:hypothetical protein
MRQSNCEMPEGEEIVREEIDSLRGKLQDLTGLVKTPTNKYECCARYLLFCFFPPRALLA